MIMLNHNLHVFLIAAETLSLTETARKLYISQPAVSQAIRKLEEELNVPLFIRVKKNRLLLTEIGAEVFRLGNQMYSLESRLYQAAYAENHNIAGTVRIASVPLGIISTLSPILQRFKSQFPQITVELLERGNPEVRRMVENAQVELGICADPGTGLQNVRLYEDRIVSIHSSEEKPVDLTQELSDVILTQIGEQFISTCLGATATHLSHCQIVQSMHAQISLVSQGNGTGLISQMVITCLSPFLDSLRTGPVTPEINYGVYLVARDFSALSIAGNALKNMLLTGKEDAPER